MSNIQPDIDLGSVVRAHTAQTPNDRLGRVRLSITSFAVDSEPHRRSSVPYCTQKEEHDHRKVMMSKITRNERLLEQIIHASLDKPRISHMLARLRTIKTYQNVVLSVELAAAWEAGWCNAARTIVNAFGTSDTAVTESLTIQPSVPYGCSHSSISPDDSNLGYVSTVEVRSDIHAPSPTTFMDDVSIEDGLILRRSVRQVYGTCHEHDKQTTITNQ